MTSIILPPSTFYNAILPHLQTKEEIESLIDDLEDLRHILIQLRWRFRYGPNFFTDKKFYRQMQIEQNEITRYLVELTELKKSK